MDAHTTDRTGQDRKDRKERDGTVWGGMDPVSCVRTRTLVRFFVRF